MKNVYIKGYPEIKADSAIVKKLIPGRDNGYVGKYKNREERNARAFTASFLIEVRNTFNCIRKQANESMLLWCMIIRKIPVGIEVPTLNVYLGKPILWVSWNELEGNNIFDIEVVVEVELENGERVTLREHEYSIQKRDTINILLEEQSHLIKEYPKKAAVSSNFKDKIFYMRSRGVSMMGVYSLLFQSLEKRNIIFFEARQELRDYFFN